MNPDDVEQVALSLDPKSRARLAEKLLASLDALTESEVDQLWVEEAERRGEESDGDPPAWRSADDVLRDAKAKLR